MGDSVVRDDRNKPLFAKTALISKSSGSTFAPDVRVRFTGGTGDEPTLSEIHYQPVKIFVENILYHSYAEYFVRDGDPRLSTMQKSSSFMSVAVRP